MKIIHKIIIKSYKCKKLLYYINLSITILSWESNSLSICLFHFFCLILLILLSLHQYSFQLVLLYIVIWFEPSLVEVIHIFHKSYFVISKSSQNDTKKSNKFYEIDSQTQWLYFVWAIGAHVETDEDAN